MTESQCTKRCGKCKQHLPRSSFHKRRAAKDGLQSRCKGCCKINHAAWREANREQYREYCRAYYYANPEQQRESNRAWQRANPDKVRATNNRRRALRRNAEGTHTADQVAARFAFHGHRCVYCGASGELHADHYKPLSKGGSNWPSNIVPACRTCNVRKKDKWGKDLKAFDRFK